LHNESAARDQQRVQHTLEDNIAGTPLFN